jgi:hypothetical protein
MALVPAPARDPWAAPAGFELVTTTTSADDGPFRDQPRTAIELRGRVWKPSKVATVGSLVYCAGLLADLVIRAPYAVVIGLLAGGTAMQVVRFRAFLRARKRPPSSVIVGLHDDHIEIGIGEGRGRIALDFIARWWVGKVHGRAHAHQLYLEDRSGGTTSVLNSSQTVCEYTGRLIEAHVRRYWQRRLGPDDGGGR